MLSVNTLRASRCRPYWRYSANDAVYGLGGNIVRASDSDPGDSSNARFVGTQLEFCGRVDSLPRIRVSYQLFLVYSRIVYS